MENFPEYDNLDLETAVQTFHRVSEELEHLTAKKTAMQNRYDFLRRVILPKLMEQNNIASAKFSNIGRGVRLQDELFVSCREENREALYQWLADHGEGELIKLTVAPSTLKAYVGRAIKDGKEYPAELLHVSVVPTARFY